jgi:hypothetical protein
MAIVGASLAARNAISAARLDTLPATVPKVVDIVVDTVEGGMAVPGLAVVSRHATPAAGTATWPVTALKGRNVTTVRGHFCLMFLSPLALLGLTSPFL